MGIKLNEESKKVVNNIEVILAAHEDFNPDQYMFADDIQSVFKDIGRIKKEFESDMFFIATVGSIKSGKSTLINLLSHKEVSTTKQGKETTIRPAIISQGEKDEIFLFNYSGSIEKDEDKNKAFSEAIDYVKGWVSDDELTKVKVIHRDATETNIAKYLTQKSITGESDPVLVNVRVAVDRNKYPSSLLLQNIAVIDTPGIDGILAGAEGLKDDNVKLELMNKVDMMLFLQSSITPINKESNDYIKKLADEHEISTMRLVHNKFSLKEWRTSLNIELDDSDSESIESAKQLFKGVVAEIKHNIVDFAKAEDGYKFCEEGLLKESGFSDFEQDLYEDLQINRSEYKEKSVINSFKNLIDRNIGHINKEGDTNLKTIEKNIKEKETEWIEEENEYIVILNKLAKFFQDNKRVLRLVDEPRQENQVVDDGWEVEETIKYTKSDRCPQRKFTITGGMKGSKILEELENIAENETKKLKNDLNKSKIFTIFVSKSKPTDCDKTIEELLLEFNEKNTKIQMEAFSFVLDIDKYCEKVEIDAEDIYDKVKRLKDKLFFGIPDLKKDQLEKLEELTKDEIRREAEKMVIGFQDILKAEINSQFKAYVEKIEEKKEEVKQILSDSRGTKNEQLKNTKETCQDLKEFFKNNS